VRRVRLWAGLTLLTYLATHLANHALGLVSLAALEAGRAWFLGIWRNPAGTLILYGALLAHLALALWSLFRRRHLRMPAWEAWQLVLGLTIPPLLAGHVVATRLAHAWFDATDSYTRVVLGLWVLRPEVGLRQATVLLVAWLHGCIGVHFWLRFRSWYPRVAPVLLAVAVLLPVLALLGFVQAGRELAVRASTPGWTEAALRAAGAPDPAERAALDRAQNQILAGFGIALGAVLLGRSVRTWRARRRGIVRIRYPDDHEVAVPVGFSLLEASRFAGIPHASVCGGRGRCSTCRVRVTRGLDSLAGPSPDEARVLRRIGAAPNVRLACQVRPARDVAVTPLLPGHLRPDGIPGGEGAGAGSEQQVAVLFADLRGFTRLAERKLPYDVVFVLNRYFEAVGRAIEQAGGIPNQFTGDGVMALFGVTGGPEDGCRRALRAASAMVRNLAQLSYALAEELPAPLRIGIGIHVGPAVVGRMGFAGTHYLTAVGDTVHVAARLEELTKEYGCQLVISEEVAERAGIDASAYPRHELAVRNRREPLAIRVIDDVTRLAAPSPRDPSA
jgi:adenylate cyclase